MFANYIKIAIRNIKRNLVFSCIIIIGLGIGVSVSILLFSYVSYEGNYEAFYPNNDRIYRISYTKFLNGSISESLAQSPEALANTIRDELPSAQATTQIYRMNDVTVNVADTKFNESNVFWVDTHFMSIFTPQLIYGSSTGDGVLISESTTKKYFSHPEKAINQSIEITGEDNVLTSIIGVFKDLPANTHFKYEILLIQDEEEITPASWKWTGVYTYTLLREGITPDNFETKLNRVVTEKTKGIFDFNISTKVELQPLQNIHLHSNLQEEIKSNSRYQIIILLSAIGIVLLLVAILNSVNLYTAQSIERTKEMGVRKVLGTNRFGLMGQFMVEAAIYNLISICLAISIALLLMPYFADFCGKPLLAQNLIFKIHFWIGVSAILIIGTLAFGIYPVYRLSSIQPIRAIKGEVAYQQSGRLSLKNGLIIFQHAATIFVMIATLVIYKQLQFMREHELGMDINQLVVVRAANIEKEKWSEEQKTYVIDSGYYRMVQNFKQKVESFHSFRMASVSHIPGKELVWGTEGFRREESSPDEVQSLNMQGIDYDFLNVFGISLLSGRNFSRKFATDQLSAVLINESALRLLGFPNPDEAIGKNLVFYDGSKKMIIGIVKDFHQESLKKTIKPVFFQLLPRALNYIAIKIPSQKVENSISILEKQWNSTFTMSPFNYFFLNDFYNNQYKNEVRFFKVSSVFMILCVIIANIGLFGLTAYMISLRTKEIGIRKVLGATISNLIVLLSKRQIALLTIGFLLAFPISYILFDTWLNNYAFRTDLYWWIFALPFLVSLLVTGITVGSQSLKHALKNPEKALRNE